MQISDKRGRFEIGSNEKKKGNYSGCEVQGSQFTIDCILNHEPRNFEPELRKKE